MPVGVGVLSCLVLMCILLLYERTEAGSVEPVLGASQVYRVNRLLSSFAAGRIKDHGRIVVCGGRDIYSAVLQPYTTDKAHSIPW